MLVLLLTACTVFQPIDGSWLVQLERESVAKGDCASDSGGGDGVYTGVVSTWFDGYTIAGNQVAISAEGALLVGTLTGTALEVSQESGFHQGSYSEASTISLVATLSGDTMEGEIVGDTTTKSDGDTYNCTNTTGFTAARSSSDPNTFATH